MIINNKLMKHFQKITTALALYLVIGLLNTAKAQTSWKTQFENDKVTVQYRLADCTDKVNDTHFSYYVMRFVNKTKTPLNVTFDTAAKKGNAAVQNEDYNSFIMQPSEIREGDCLSRQKGLRFFAKTNATVNKAATDEVPLLILNIKTYEL